MQIRKAVPGTFTFTFSIVMTIAFAWLTIGPALAVGEAQCTNNQDCGAMQYCQKSTGDCDGAGACEDNFEPAGAPCSEDDGDGCTIPACDGVGQCDPQDSNVSCEDLGIPDSCCDPVDGLCKTSPLDPVCTLCGNGTVDPGEDCDPPSDSNCSGQCDDACQCPLLVELDEFVAEVTPEGVACAGSRSSRSTTSVSASCARSTIPALARRARPSSVVR